MSTKRTVLTEALNDIIPGNLSVDENIMQDMPQFITKYMEQKRESMIKQYPHRKDIIVKSYEHILHDLNVEHDWLNHADW